MAGNAVLLASRQRSSSQPFLEVLQERRGLTTPLCGQAGPDSLVPPTTTCAPASDTGRVLAGGPVLDPGEHGVEHPVEAGYAVASNAGTALGPSLVRASRWPLRKLNSTMGASATTWSRETADPVRMMRLFGITSYTAIHYVRTAHPEHFAIDPTQA
ncbi:hypothetical protein OG520_37950 [Streptomyces sp. NBC_00984]|uniref:hypothetical protein n=1 Tax=Streptomyces sp. NBC_00984 TaxID=2903700 RepID=UPI003865EEA7|nr:hypothetical protein OG520_37950 [Streptomyces sp. NBC_00984]